MIGFDLLTPWIAFGVSLWLLLRVQRWIQRHLFGVGWIVAQEKHAASVIYTIVLLPGIFLHEFIEWMLGGVLSLKTTVSLIWPEADANGTIDPKFVQVSGTKNPIFLSIIGLAPFLIGLAITLLISNSLLNFPLLITALGTADLTLISPVIADIFSKPDVVLWLYLLFSVSNTMMPTRSYIRSWAVFAGLAGGVLLFLAAAGFGNVVLKWFTGPISSGLNLLSTVFVTVLALDCIVALGLRAIEAVMERVTQRQAPYRAAAAKANAVARAAKAAPPRLTSIYQYKLPIPPVAGKDRRPVVSTPGTSTGLPRPAQPSIPPPAPRPAVAASSTATGSTGTFGTPTAPKPSGQPAAPAPRPSTSSPSSTPASSPGLTPARPAFGSPTTPRPNEPARQPEPIRPAASQPQSPGQQPARPAVPSPGQQPARTFGTPTPGSAQPPPGGRPALPASTSGPRPSNLPVPTAKPTPPPSTPARSPFSTPGNPVRPSPFGTPPKKDEPDYIDADVIEDDIDDEEPGFARRFDDRKGRTDKDRSKPGNPPKRPSLFSDDEYDDDDPKYVDLDDNP